MMMTSSPLPNAYRGYRFPGQVIAHAVWLSTCAFHSVFGMWRSCSLKRGIQVSYETVRCWAA
ncbi:MAG: hypothetical protein H0X52_03180 [Gemmatimonadetes bacterium]|nr:hypothetical protein [Gemmatimonadota bacterium]